MKFNTNIIAGLFTTLAVSAMGADIYVDSSFTGVSDGSQTAPFTAIKDAAAVVGEGDTIWVYGSDTVSYTFDNDSCAVVIDPDNVTLRGYTDAGEATDWYETNKMARVYVVDGYANDSYAIDGQTDRPFTLNGANPKISGIYFDYGGTSFRQQNKGGDNMIVVTNSNFVCENSFFYMSSNTGYDGASTPIAAYTIKNPVEHNMVFRNCGFNFFSTYRNAVCIVGKCNGTLTFENSYFEHLYSLSKGGDNNNNFRTTIYAISNIFYNCYSVSPEKYHDAIFSSHNNSFPKRAVIAYNRIIRDDFDPASKYSDLSYNFLAHGGAYGGSFNDSEIHHNTIVGLDIAFISRRYRQGNDSADLWTPAIHNNLFVLNDGGVFIEEKEGVPDDKTGWGGPGIMFSGDRTTSFLPGSYIRNNAILCDVFVTGDATTNSWYKLEYEEGANSGVELIDNINLEEALTFINTTDPFDENFYRLRLEDYEWVRKNAWRGDNLEYPNYMGALEPIPVTGFLIILH